MGSGSSGAGASEPGTISPVTSVLLSLFGAKPRVIGGQFQPSQITEGGLLSPSSFGALPGLLTNMPATGAESFLTSGGFQNQLTSNALMSQDILQQGTQALPGLLASGTDAATALARRQFSQETLPTILERAPGFSSSDLQRETVRAGTDLETQIAALRQSADLQRAQLITQTLPGYAQAVGSNLADQASSILGYGQVGRDFLREVSPAGDAFRVLSALQALTGPGITGRGTQSSKSAGVLS